MPYPTRDHNAQPCIRAISTRKPHSVTGLPLCRLQPTHLYGLFSRSLRGLSGVQVVRSRWTGAPSAPACTSQRHWTTTVPTSTHSPIWVVFALASRAIRRASCAVQVDREEGHIIRQLTALNKSVVVLHAAVHVVQAVAVLSVCHVHSSTAMSSEYTCRRIVFSIGTWASAAAVWSLARCRHEAFRCGCPFDRMVILRQREDVRSEVSAANVIPKGS